MTSKAAAEASLTKLFSQLQLAGEEGDYEWAADIVDEILGLSPDDPDALHCKVVCLVQLAEYGDAVKLINQLNKKTDDDNGFVYENAYCCYKMEKYEESLKILCSLPQEDQSTVKVLDLRAQVLYRVEKFAESAQAFCKSRQHEDSQERSVNMAAALSYCPPKMAQDMIKSLPIATDTMEQCFNVATIRLQSLNNADLSTACDLLKRACALCRDDIIDDDELEQEMIPINAQLAYCLHRRGNTEQATALYTSALKAKPSNPAHTLALANNLLVLNRDKDIFDSKKKVKLMSSEAGLKKLTSNQALVVLYNKCLFALQTNQLEQCRQYLSQLKTTSPLSDLTNIANAALLYREKKVSEAIKVLTNCSDGGSILVHLTLAQLYASQGKYDMVREVLEGVADVAQYLGVVSTLVTHYLAADCKDQAMKLLDTVFRWWRDRKDVPPSSCYKVLWDIAVYKVQCGVPQESVAILEYLCQQMPGEVKYLAYLIYCYAQFDHKMAEELSHRLPQFTASTAVDVDSLEESFRHTRRQVAKSVEKKETAAQSPSETQVRTAKKKKRKPRLPKNYDPNKQPDPERWLPLQERSYYRKGKKKNQPFSVGRGTQGSSAATASITAKLDASKVEESPTLSPRASTTTTTTAAKPKPPQQRKQQQRKKKGKR